jgi:beta-lactamase regulating signal transducer with metallopeptidase domain
MDSDDIGPAVVGIIRPRIVVPRWLQNQDAATQGIVMAHEREHVLAQDIRVLGGALLVAVLLPRSGCVERRRPGRTGAVVPA